jgi:DNA-binding NtrC family response regulator
MTALQYPEVQQETIKVLLVEDDKPIQDMLRILLRSKRVEVKDTLQGLKDKILSFDPHVVILDYKLTDGDAMDALASFHSLVKRNIPIVFTAHKIPDPIQTQLYMMGVMNILIKPSSISTIESVIENYYEVSMKYRS